MKTLVSHLSLTALITISGMTATGFAASSELGALSEKAGNNYSTKEGRRYAEKFQQAIMPVFGKAMDDCNKTTPDTVEPASLVFVVAANGTISRILYSKDIPFGVCLGAKLRGIKKVPRPPRDGWVVALGAANHSAAERAKGPPDTPKLMKSQQSLAAYDRAIAPYIAKARATYPAAKKRFIAGLAPGYSFSVRVPLRDPSGKREDSFVSVEKIKDGKITGTIANQLDLVKSYKSGQRITVPESQIDNWVIVRPDGTEEGNAVGKFLDHYKPR